MRLEIALAASCVSLTLGACAATSADEMAVALEREPYTTTYAPRAYAPVLIRGATVLDGMPGDPERGEK